MLKFRSECWAGMRFIPSAPRSIFWEMVSSRPSTATRLSQFQTIIHPFSDFLLHNIGTGDGVVQNGGQSTRNKLRTPALWGMRTRDRLMHDGETLNRNEAILRHAGEANGVVNNYQGLSTTQKNQLIKFLISL